MARKKGQTEDLRVQRTRKFLMQAMIDLIVEKGFLGITVQDISDRAMVNRATFYRHYRDKYDLLEQYINEVYKLTASGDESSPAQTNDKDPSNPPVGMVRMNEHVQTHADFYRVMLGTKGDPSFVQKMQQYTEMRLREAYGTRLKSESLPSDLCLSYLSYAGIGALVWWLNNGKQYTPKQIAGWILQLNEGVLSKAGVAKA